MTVVLVAAALIAGTGAVAALAPADVRLGLIGLTACLAAAAFLSDPAPAPAVLAIRVSAALLAVVSLRAAASSIATAHGAANRGWSGHLMGSRLGWPAQILLGLGGAAAGLAIAQGLASFSSIGDGNAGQPSQPIATAILSAPSLTLAAAGLIAAIALGPVLGETAGMRRAIAVVLATQAAILVRAALASPSTVPGEILLGAMLVVVAAAGAALAVGQAGSGEHVVTAAGHGP